MNLRVRDEHGFSKPTPYLARIPEQRQERDSNPHVLADIGFQDQRTTRLCDLGVVVITHAYINDSTMFKFVKDILMHEAKHRKNRIDIADL